LLGDCNTLDGTCRKPLKFHDYGYAWKGATANVIVKFTAGGKEVASLTFAPNDGCSGSPIYTITAKESDIQFFWNYFEPTLQADTENINCYLYTMELLPSRPAIVYIVRHQGRISLSLLIKQIKGMPGFTGQTL
jgi:hypothetical protein